MKLKKILNSIWNEFVYGGHLISLGAASIVFTSAILLDIKITWDCLLVVYLGTQSVYLYNHFKEFDKDSLTNPQRSEHIEKYVKYIPLITLFFSLTAIVIVIYFNKILALLFGLLMLFGGLLYSKFLKKFTRRIIGFKDFLISFLWATLVIFLAYYYFFSWNFALILMVLFIFLRLFLNTNFFDMKDVESDIKEGLLTLPVILGKKTLIKFLTIINMLSMIPIIFGVFLDILPNFSLILLLTIPYSFYYLKQTSKESVDLRFLSYVLVDGEYLLWSIFILLGKNLL